MTAIAVVTGASSGLGRAFVKKLSGDSSIEGFYVIARRKDRLEELSQEVSQKVTVLPLDLCDPGSMDALKKILEEEKPEIRVLVNAAGMGKVGRTDEQSLETVNRMIDLNIRALADVTAVCLPYMKKGSRIIEIGSVAGFQPLPSFNVYSASKAFVESYSKCLHYELIGKGIHVTCLCPYWVKDTEFIPVSKTDGVKRYGNMFLAEKTKHVVSVCDRDSKMNLWVSTPGVIPVLDRFFSWVLPHCLYVPLMDLVSRL